jgi:hypothetical protein
LVPAECCTLLQLLPMPRVLLLLLLLNACTQAAVA